MVLSVHILLEYMYLEDVSTGAKAAPPLWIGWTKEFRTLLNKMILLDMRG